MSVENEIRVCALMFRHNYIKSVIIDFYLPKGNNAR